MNNVKKKKTIFNNVKRRKQFLFYWGLILLPMIQFCIMYVAVNIRSLMFVFQQYDEFTSEYVTDASYFLVNIKEAVGNIFGSAEGMEYAWKNTLISYFFGLATMPISLTISFFIYKKLPLAGYFRVVYYIPSIINGFVTIFGCRYLVEKGFPALFPNLNLPVEGLIANPNTAFWTLTLMSYWTSIGSGLVLNTGMMSRTSKEVLEAAQIDGVNLIQEFTNVIWPVIYPVVTIGLYTGITGIFLAGPDTFTYFEANAPRELYTFSYFMFTRVVGTKSSLGAYPISASMGVLFTIVCAPLVFLGKYLFEKYDPNGDYVSKRKVKSYGI